MVVGFTTTCAISVYLHFNCKFETRSWRVVFDTALSNQVCQWLTVIWDRYVFFSETLIAQVVVNPTTTRLRPQRPLFLIMTNILHVDSVGFEL